MQGLEDYCTPKKNEVMELFRFFFEKADCEPFDKYYTDLKQLIRTCGLGDAEDKILRAQIVLRLYDKEVQARLLRENLTLPKVVNFCQATEQAERNQKIVQEKNKQLYKIKQLRQPDHNTGRRHQKVEEDNTRNKDKFVKNCYKCGRSHKWNDCVA